MSALVGLRDAEERDLPAVHEIYQHYVRTSTCTYQLEPDDLEATRVWFAQHDPARHPIVVAESAGTVVGWGSLSPYRARAGYAHTVENSVYVDHRRHGQGIGSALLAALIERARAIGHHAILAGIDGEQTASVRLHEKHGFEKVAHLREVGSKFGRWLDVIYMELLLSSG